MSIYVHAKYGLTAQSHEDGRGVHTSISRLVRPTRPLYVISQYSIQLCEKGEKRLVVYQEPL